MVKLGDNKRLYKINGLTAFYTLTFFGCYQSNTGEIFEILRFALSLFLDDGRTVLRHKNRQTLRHKGRLLLTHKGVWKHDFKRLNVNN